MSKQCLIGMCFIAIIINPNSGYANEALASAVDRGFFAGVGGSFNSVALEDQTIFGKGVNNAYLSTTLLSSGSAAGSTNPFYYNENVLSPYAQVGYFQHFEGSANFLGIKFFYSYLNAHISDDDVAIPQAGSNYDYLTNTTTNFTGNFTAQSVQTTFQHEFVLLPFVGYSFDTMAVYAGIGPALFKMQSNVYSAVGYADYNGTPGTNISGAPVNFSQSLWKLGGAAQWGLAYSPFPSWFIDLNYTYAIMPKNTIKYTSPFTNQIDLETLVGTTYMDPSQKMNLQSISLSINKVF